MNFSNFNVIVILNLVINQLTALNHIMSYLKNNVVLTMNLFYQNSMFSTLDLFILFLEQTYDDISCKHNIITKLKEFQQQNLEFTCFFSEFLNLVEELK